MCFVTRYADESGFVAEGVPTLTLGALDDQSARRVLRDSVGDLPPDVSDRLLAESGGNPLALLELPTALSPAERTGAEPLPASLTLTTTVERAFLDRSRLLAPEAQTVLLAAVADGTGRLGTLQRATKVLGIAPEVLDDVVRSGLVVVDGDAADVRHPLVRSAVYQGAGDRERRRVHIALADVFGQLQDPDRQTWHRAAAADGPDPGLAAALDRVAARAESRGAHRAAVEAHQRAAELGTVAESAARLFAAARNAWTAGLTARAEALAAAARPGTDDPLLLADLDRLRARIEVNTGSADDAHRILTRAAERVAAHDPLRALEMAVAAAVARSHGVDSGAVLPPGTVDVRDAADDTPRTRSLKHLLVSIEHAMAGDRADAVAELDGGDRCWAHHRRPRPARQPGQRRPAPGRGRHPSRRLRPDALGRARERRRDGGAVRAAAHGVRAVRRWQLERAACVVRGGGLARAERRAARADGDPAGVAHAPVRAAGQPRPRRPPGSPRRARRYAPRARHPGPSVGGPRALGRRRPGRADGGPGRRASPPRRDPAPDAPAPRGPRPDRRRGPGRRPRPRARVGRRARVVHRGDAPGLGAGDRVLRPGPDRRRRGGRGPPRAVRAIARAACLDRPPVRPCPDPAGPRRAAAPHRTPGRCATSAA